MNAFVSEIKEWNKTDKNKNKFEDFVVKYFDNIFLKND